MRERVPYLPGPEEQEATLVQSIETNRGLLSRHYAEYAPLVANEQLLIDLNDFLYEPDEEELAQRYLRWDNNRDSFTQLPSGGIDYIGYLLRKPDGQLLPTSKDVHVDELAKVRVSIGLDLPSDEEGVSIISSEQRLQKRFLPYTKQHAFIIDFEPEEFAGLDILVLPPPWNYRPDTRT